MSADREGGFAARLRWWRRRRGFSQLELAHAAEVSQRHVSFLELGRAAPSRDMVLRLSAALALPLRQENDLLVAAGFAPLWRETPLEGGELAAVSRALDFMLEQQEPYPAFVVDRRWNLLRANLGAGSLVGWLLDQPGWTPDPAQPVNLADALVAPDLLRPFVANWREVVLYFVRAVHGDSVIDGSDETNALLARLLRYPDCPRLSDLPALDEAQGPVLAIEFVKGATTLRLFTTLATLGTPRNVTTQDVRVENFFAADAQTTEVFQRWARSPA